MAENTNKWQAPNPWLGLGSYSEGQHLYGRDKEISELTGIICNHAASVIYGKSGIGKSSILRAGVFPQLRSKGFVPIYLRLVHNTDVSYVQQIESAIRENVTLDDLLPDNIPDLGLWDFLHRYHFMDGEGNTVTPVIVLDQFEEIFTLTQVDHKSDVQNLFAELADVLNDIKPDRVMEAEKQYAQKGAVSEQSSSSSGFILQSLSNATLRYEKSLSFRLVFSLRDDSLYLLERNSAKIPAIKANRYNLCALDEESAREVITRPIPNLFTDTNVNDILNGLAYYEYDDYRVVEPAILSLFLYSYYREQGKVSYDNIFEKYYLESIQPVSTSTISYVEDELLTEDGFRKRIPYKQLLNKGISGSEIAHLEKCIILKREKDYVEFSHDLLCKEALKHKSRRLSERSKKRMRILIYSFAAVLLTVILTVWALWPETPPQMVTLNFQIKGDGSFDNGEPWTADFCFLSSSKDSMLALPVQDVKGRILENMRADDRDSNSLRVLVPKDFIDRERVIRIALFNTSENCRADTVTIDLRQWYRTKDWKLAVQRIPKIPFVGKVVDEDGQPIAKALVLLGTQPMQVSDEQGGFRFFLQDSALLKQDLYVFRKGYDGEHFFGDLLKVCGKGSDTNPFVVALRNNNQQAADIDFKKVFAEQRYAVVALYGLARIDYRKDSIKLEVKDSASLDSAIKVYPQYALNLKKLRRTRKHTRDKTLDLYCVSVDNPNVKGLRNAVGNYLYNGKDHVFQGKLMKLETNKGNSWRLSAISWDRDNKRYVIQGILNSVDKSNEGYFDLEVRREYGR